MDILDGGHDAWAIVKVIVHSSQFHRRRRHAEFLWKVLQIEFGWYLSCAARDHGHVGTRVECQVGPHVVLLLPGMVLFQPVLRHGIRKLVCAFVCVWRVLLLLCCCCHHALHNAVCSGRASQGRAKSGAVVARRPGCVSPSGQLFAVECLPTAVLSLHEKLIESSPAFFIVHFHHVRVVPCFASILIGSKLAVAWLFLLQSCLFPIAFRIKIKRIVVWAANAVCFQYVLCHDDGCLSNGCSSQRRFWLSKRYCARWRRD